MKNSFKKFLKDESGATAIEYGLIAAILGVGIIGSLGSVKNALNAKFNAISTNLNSAS